MKDLSTEQAVGAGDAPAAPGARDIRIDIVRGLALVCIYIDHAPGNALAAVTLKAFGLCDASEVFVLISGMASALAYGPLFRRDRRAASLRILKRIGLLFLAQLIVAIAAVSALLWAARYFDNPAYYEHSTLALLSASTMQNIAGLVSLTLQPGYLHILPLYVVLLSTLPAILRLRDYHVLAPLGISVFVWIAAQSGLNLPAMGEPRGWYFDPFGWQLLFTIGIVAATVGMGPGGIPRSRWLLAGAVTIVAGAFAVAAPWKIVPALSKLSLVDPALIDRQPKHALAPLRLLNVLALAYLVAYVVPRNASWLRSFGSQSLAMIGKSGLLCFGIATVLDEWLLIWRLQGGRGVVYQLVVNVGGVLLLIAVAHATATWARSRSRTRQALGEEPRLSLAQA